MKHWITSHNNFHFLLFFLTIRVFNIEIRWFFITLNIGIRNLADKCGIAYFILNLLIQKKIDNSILLSQFFFTVDTLLFNNSRTNGYSLLLSFSFSVVPTFWFFTDNLVINFFSTNFVNFFITSISFKIMFWREIKLWVLPLYTDLIGRLEVTGKSEGSKGVCWVAGVITVSRLATKLSETEDVKSI